MKLTVLGNHPFFRHSAPTVFKNGTKWRVKYRDFYTVKQDADFDTEQEARAFASGVNRAPITLDDDEQDLDGADQFWKSMP